MFLLKVGIPYHSLYKSNVAKPIVDNNNIIFGVVVPPPQDDPYWSSAINNEAAAALMRERDGTAKSTKGGKMGFYFKQKERIHRRGKYSIQVDGISLGGGQKVRYNLEFIIKT